MTCSSARPISALAAHVSTRVEHLLVSAMVHRRATTVRITSGICGCFDFLDLAMCYRPARECRGELVVEVPQHAASQLRQSIETPRHFRPLSGEGDRIEGVRARSAMVQPRRAGEMVEHLYRLSSSTSRRISRKHSPGAWRILESCSARRQSYRSKPCAQPRVT
jgi:hypothetical protein